MRQVPEVGDTVAMKSFAFVNKSGGTGLSNDNPEYSEKFVGEATARITETWDDYEIGTRYIGKAISADLVAYMKRNSKDGRVLFGQFDLKRIA